MGSEARVVVLSDGWGHLHVHPRADRTALTGITRPHARLADGRTVVWAPPADAAGAQVAVDAEMARTAVPDHVAHRLVGSDANRLAQWTHLEVLAKLSGTPVLLLLRGQASPPTGIACATIRVEDLTVSLGWRRTDAAPCH